MNHQDQEVVVIGGGFSGLASAGLLAARGCKVTLIEQQEHPGGRSGRLEREGFRFDTGPSWYLMPEVFDHWFRLMGTSTAEQLDLRELPTGYRVFFQNRQAPADFGIGAAASDLFETLEPGSAPALERYLRTAKEGYELALEHFLYDDFHSLKSLLDPRILRRAPQLAKLLSTSLQSHVARRFASNEIRQVLGYPAVFLGSSPEKTPALYQLMSHLDLADGVKYPMGGFAAVADAMAQLARKHGAQIQLGATATAIETSTGKNLAVSAVRWIDANGTLHRTPATKVIGAADVRHLEGELLPESLQTHTAKSFARKDPGPSAVLLCLGIKGKLPQLEHHNLLFTEDWSENFSRIRQGRELEPETSIYVCKPSATDPGTAPEGCENLFILVPAPALPEWGIGAADGQGDAAVEAVAEAAIDQLSAWARIDDLRERIVVRQSIGPGDFAQQYGAYRGGALGLAHTLGQSAMLRPGNRSAKVEGLYYAGSTVRPGIGVPMCLISGELAAKAVLGIKEAGPMPEHRSVMRAQEAGA
ncbi:phytoene desaturase family protein [Glutamicibacter arilaitensis]|uniref:phytoene desaturase family protein n=1 Tax=Glutamicibacter arilaitensis TaxID=256701 RepID=UPI003FCFA1C2